MGMPGGRPAELGSELVAGGVSLEMALEEGAA